MALIAAIPAAAPTPPKYAVGKVQKMGCDVMIPMVTRHNAAMAHCGGRCPANINPIPIKERDTQAKVRR